MQSLISLLRLLTLPIVLVLGIVIGLAITQIRSSFNFSEIRSPWVTSQFVEKPLQKYAIAQLDQVKLQPSQVIASEQLEETADYTRYLFYYTTTGKKMSGLLTIPKEPASQRAVIVMVRGYIPQQGYESGDGTRNAAAVYAKAGFITIAPDFLGFGQSDAERSDVLLGRFEKPVQVMELISSLRATGITIQTQEMETQLSPFDQIGLWGHSNGGQITVATLEGWQEPIPATLWAPVTAPFPYSLLFFSDTDPDEGKETRDFIALFEKNYDVFDFSLTRHVDRLAGPIQLHHGSADGDALQIWSDRFATLISNQNKARQPESQVSTTGAQLETKAPIEFTYYQYPGADHNLRPDWNTVVNRDVAFFTEKLLR